MKDIYEILGVEPTATDKQIKKMYFKLAKKYHADANIDDPDLKKWSHTMMTELNQVYEILKNPHKRAEYNRRMGYPPPSKTEVEQQRQQELADLYHEAMRHFQTESWQEAIDKFEAIQQIDPYYRNVADRLGEAKQNKLLAELSAKAEKLIRQKRWVEAEKILAQIRQMTGHNKNNEDQDDSTSVPPNQSSHPQQDLQQSSILKKIGIAVVIGGAIVVLVFGLLLIFASSSGIAPFIYTLF